MGQSYKNIYFRDCPETASGRSSLTMAFGKGDRDVFEAVQHLSSDTLRNALGYHSFMTLQEDAQVHEKSLNAFCLSILRKRFKANGDSDALCLPGFDVGNPFDLDPIQATFIGGRHEPLHEWYPYLEGYSPAYVESLIGSYCQDATSIFDPFSGAGTTPLTASRLAKKAYFSEINPVLQYLTASKVAALQLTDKERAEVVADLITLAETLDCRLGESGKAFELRRTYEAVFGESRFFDSNVFDDILRLRTLIDDTAYTSPKIARFLTIAVLRSLVPASRLVRRGDLRYKTEKEQARNQTEIRDEVRDALTMIASDIESLSRIDQVPILLLENAKNLPSLPTLAIDAVITSPPYLNGTNYFRNTKIELWFLGCLKNRKDLARFRFASMTVGINDVTVGKPIGQLPPSAAPVLKALEAKAYDARIPRMVACFASEMHALLKAMAVRTTRNGTIIIDIGDSAYAGVHVPTDAFISESLNAAGFELTDERVLRQRYSRSQMKLTQKLLVFKPKLNKRRRVLRSKKSAYGWLKEWATFKSELPHQQNEFAKRNWGHPLHSLCSYQGKMKPSLASFLVRTFTKPGERMLDPFAGVGTIPFEAALQGVESWGYDISPVAVHTMAGKVGNLDPVRCLETVHLLENYVNNQEAKHEEQAAAGSIKFNGPITSYFNWLTLEEILLARRFFLENPPMNASQSLVLACLLHILHGNRPYALSRRSHPITPFAPSGKWDYRALIPRLRRKVERSLSAAKPDGFAIGRSIFQDATDWWPPDINELDAIITSPPFFNSTRFYLGNWMRMWFCGWEGEDFHKKPFQFVDERQKRGFEVYNPVFRQCRERLKKDGVVVFHLGASKKCDMATELAKIAKRWFRVVDVFAECVSHCETHGIRDQGTVVKHQYLVLQ